MPSMYLVFVITSGFLALRYTVAFSPALQTTARGSRCATLCNRAPSTRPRPTSKSSLLASDEDAVGDPIRASTGIRPSLHPTTINAIAEALKIRAKKIEGQPLEASEDVAPIDVVMTASQIAATQIAQRQKASEQDGMKLNSKEEQTIAGRVIGVVIRLSDLELTLQEKVSEVSWVAKYNEWATFGVLKSNDDRGMLDERIMDDPLFSMSRAECLLALFLESVEKPQLQNVEEAVPDESRVDFLDADRREVLLE